MNDFSSSSPSRPTRRKRARLGRAIGVLRQQLSLYRALFVASAVLVAVLAAALLFRPSASSAPVPLGTGQAGVMTAEPSTPYAADAIEAEPEPETNGASTEPGAHLADGHASYYGDELAGNPTASGERFDPAGLTAAHRTLPLGSRVRVTNLRTGAVVVVRINDRGPFTGHRVIDLSKAAARQIGMLRRGTAQVRLELLDA